MFTTRVMLETQPMNHGGWTLHKSIINSHDPMEVIPKLGITAATR